MKQKIQDFLVLIKKDRKTQIISGVVGLFVIAAMLMPAPPQRSGGGNKAQDAVGIGAPDPNEAYNDLLKRFDDQMVEMQTGMKEVRTEIGDIRKEHTAFQERTTVIFQKMLNRMSELGEQTPVSADGGQGTVVDVTPEEGGAPTETAEAPESLEPLFDGSGAGTEPVPPTVPEPPRVAVISPGDTVRLKLLAGVNAPVKGAPYPTMFKLISDVAGPDGSSLPLGEARLIAAAQGSLTDGRVLFRLTDLSIRLPDGSRKTVKVDGWIVGEDGVRGMQGRVIDQLGRALGGAAMVGATQGIGQGLAQSQLTTVVTDDGDSISSATGDIALLGVGNGIANSFGTWNRIIQDRLKDLDPVVEVLSGREATAIFARTVKVEGLFDQLDDGDVVFASLD